MHRLKSFFFLFLFASIFAINILANERTFVLGTVDYVEGDASLLRESSSREIDFGEELRSQDLIKTGENGFVVIKLDPSRGMTGTVTVRPKTTCTLSAFLEKGQPATEFESFIGTIGVKVKKLSGSPALRVRSGQAIMGVRGTEFQVDFSINASLLVSCNVGRVECTSESSGRIDVLDAIPGQVVEQRGDARFRRIPVAVSKLEEFRNRWGTEEIEAFKASPLGVLDLYAQAYTRHKADFIAASDALNAQPALKKWLREAAAGEVPYARSVSVMKEKSALAPRLMALRRVLFFFEPAYYRLDQQRDYLGSRHLGEKLSTGKTVREFLRELDGDKRNLERRTSQYRQALYLYGLRNEGKDPFGMEDSLDDGDDFFDDFEDFF